MFKYIITPVNFCSFNLQGVTKYFTKYGQFKFQNYTALPGGNPFDSRGKNTCCVLDCVYDELKKTMYILDLLVWNNLPMTDGEVRFSKCSPIDYIRCF